VLLLLANLPKHEAISSFQTRCIEKCVSSCSQAIKFAFVCFDDVIVWRDAVAFACLCLVKVKCLLANFPKHDAISSLIEPHVSQFDQIGFTRFDFVFVWRVAVALPVSDC